MSTRCTVIVTSTDTRARLEQEPVQDKRVHQYYHHHDGYEVGVGLELVGYLLNNMDTIKAYQEKLKDPRRYAHDPVPYMLNSTYKVESIDMIHGDLEYLYHIDMDRSILTMFDGFGDELLKDTDKEKYNLNNNSDNAKVLMRWSDEIEINIGG
jgi:hypothetical protein